MPTNPIEQAIDILNGAKSDVALFLSGHPALATRANQSLTSLVNVLTHTAGLAVVGDTSMSFGPMTDFLGEKISHLKVIEKAEAVVLPDEKANFKEKVKALYAEFPQLQDDMILQGGNVDKQVLRGVAKLAGVENFKEADFDFEFIAAIRAGIAAKGLIENVIAVSKKAAAKKKTDAETPSQDANSADVNDDDDDDEDPFK